MTAGFIARGPRLVVLVIVVLLASAGLTLAAHVDSFDGAYDSSGRCLRAAAARRP